MTDFKGQNYDLNDIIDKRIAIDLNEKIVKFNANLSISKGVKVPVYVIINRNNGTTTITSPTLSNSCYLRKILEKCGYMQDCYNLSSILRKIDNEPCITVVSRCHKTDKFNSIIGLKNAKRKYMNRAHRVLMRSFIEFAGYYEKLLTTALKEVDRYQPKKVNTWDEVKPSETTDDAVTVPVHAPIKFEA